MLTVQLHCDNCTEHTAQTELKHTILFKFGKLSNKCLDAGPHYNPTNTTHGSLTSPNRSLFYIKKYSIKGLKAVYIFRLERGISVSQQYLLSTN